MKMFQNIFVSVYAVLTVVHLIESTWSENIMRRIPTTISEFPYQVSVKYDGFHICSGSIIAPNLILTAANCILSMNDNLSIRAGSTFHDEGGILRDVLTTCVHPNYNNFTINNNVAILTLKDDLPITDKIQSVLLAYPGTVIDSNATAVISGWRGTLEKGIFLKNLHKSMLFKVDQDDCKIACDSMNIIITDGMVCYDCIEEEQDSCEGDSGSPLVIGRTQIGILSLGYKFPAFNKLYIDVTAPIIANFIYSFCKS